MMYSLNKIQGLTLIEVVMVMVIVGILVGITSGYIKQTVNLWDFFSFRNEIVNEARAGFLRMIREIRQIANTSAIYTANSTRFNFMDYNSNNINYYFSANNLTRNGNILIRGVDNLTFTYYNNSSAVISVPKVYPESSDIYLIAINMRVKSGTQSKTLKTRVFPRNFSKKE